MRQDRSDLRELGLEHRGLKWLWLELVGLEEVELVLLNPTVYLL